jgi:SAM-dependent methyltransferase
VTEQIPDRIDVARTYYDDVGSAEWNRLVASPRARVSLELHRRLLTRLIEPGWRVLELGAGPGRFTISLAELGASVVVSDISPVQLTLNEEKVTEAGWEAAVEERRLLDIADLSSISDGAFDAAVAFGGPLSYAFDRAEHALTECLRVTRRGGVVLASVMSAVGSFRLFLDGVVQEIDAFGIDVMDRVIRTGVQRHVAHQCRMFRWREIEDMVSRLPCELLTASASNAVSLGDPAAVEHLENDPMLWARFLDWETALAQEPGALDSGTHILFAVRRK